MDLRQLRYFREVVAQRSFSAAARQLNVAQPALSRQVRALEESLGVVLLVRTARGVHVTEAGERLRESADFVLRFLGDVARDLRTLSAEPSGDVLLGLPPSVSFLVAPRLLERAREDFPLLNLHIIEGLSVFLMDGLESGKVDLAVLTDAGQAGSRRLERVPLAEEEMVLAGTPDLLGPRGPLARHADIEALPMVMSRGFRSVIAPWLTLGRLELRGETELDSIVVTREVVRRGLFATIVPYGMIHAEVASGELRALPLADPAVARRLVMGYAATRPVSMTMRAVQKLVEDALAATPLRLGAPG
ncbi:LysR family transcriptional regulator [Leptolyngbya sp. 15MV]|jgi:LysR family transcriptional regulator, nitrogen assimilation regulatory protein|nr:LysR family transcriptional regulator [Leptolyngbya sp. 15MV]